MFNCFRVFVRVFVRVCACVCVCICVFDSRTMVQRCDCMDGQCAVTFDLSLQMRMPMRPSVQACDNCARDNSEQQGKENTRNCTNAQPLRRDCASTSTTTLILSRHDLWLNSKMLRASQTLTRCELVRSSQCHIKQSDSLVSLHM